MTDNNSMFDLSILEEPVTTSIWVPSGLQPDVYQTHLTSTSTHNPNADLEMIDDSQLEITSKLDNTTEVVCFNLFTQFIKLSESKLAKVIEFDLRLEFRLEKILSLGVDPQFDIVLTSLGSIARHNPDILINSVLTWRNKKSSALSVKEIRRQSRSQALLIERINMSVSYITCRVMISMLSQIKMARSLDQSGGQVEEFAFKLLKTFSPVAIAKSVNHQALYMLLGELLRHLSSLRFSTVSDLFIAELEQIPTQPTGPIDNEETLILIIHSMKYLKLRIYPSDALEETAEFLLSCAGFFYKSVYTRLKRAYVEVFVEMLIPITYVMDAEVNFPIWVKAIELLDQKGTKLMQKTRYHDITIPLMTTVITSSQKEVFLAKVFVFFEFCCQRIKDRVLRDNSLASLSRLIWIYLFRFPEPSATTLKKLDLIYKQLFMMTARRQLFLPDGPLQHFYYTLYYVVSYDLNYATTHWVKNLLALEPISNPNIGPFSIDSVVPERFTIVIRALLLLVLDDVNGIKVPSFPDMVDFNFDNPTQLFRMDPLPRIPDDFLKELKISPKLQSALMVLFEILETVLPALESVYGSFLCTDDKYVNRPPRFLTSPKLDLNGGYNFRDQLNEQIKAPYVNLTTLFMPYNREKQPFFDLLAAWLDSVPIFVPHSYSMPMTVDLVVRLTLHIDPQVSIAAGRALIRISVLKNHYAVVIRAMSRAIQKIHVSFSEALAPIFSMSPTSGNFETSGLNLISLQLTLLQKWLSSLKYEVTDEISEEDPNTSMNWSLIEETEALGLMLFCSPFASFRILALEVLKVTSEIDTAYNQLANGSKENSEQFNEPRVHIIDVINSTRANLIITEALKSKKLTLKFVDNIKSLGIETAVHAATQDGPEAQTLWKSAFPKLAKLIYEKSPVVTVLCRHQLSTRLKQIHLTISILSERHDNLESPSLALSPGNEILKDAITNEGMVLLHWGQYLSFVCATITMSLDAKPEPSYKRKDQKGGDTINSAKDLFRLVFVLLSCENRSIRTLIVSSLGNINLNIYGLFIEDLQPFIRLIQEDTKNRLANNEFKKAMKQDRFREGITECLAKTADMMQAQEYLHDHGLTESVVGYMKDVFKFLSQPEIQEDWSHQLLRIYFCDLARKLYVKLALVKDSIKLISFELRFQIFNLAERWSGHGQHRNSTRDREVMMMKSVLEQYKDVIQRGAKTSSMEELRKRLEISALSLMATLCKGPIITSASQDDPSGKNPSLPRKSTSMFDLTYMFKWIESVFHSPDKRVHYLAKEALDSLLTHNLDSPLLFETVLHHCYSGDADHPSTQGYFLALGEALASQANCPLTTAKKLVLIIFKIGDPSVLVRKMACRLLRLHYKPKGMTKSARLDYFCEQAVHPLPSIYERARFDISDKLAQDHPDLVLEFFSEAVMRLPVQMEHSLRVFLKALVPWVRELTLSTDFYNLSELTPISHAILTNLLYLVVKYSGSYPSEVEDLWKALLHSDTNLSALEAVIESLIQLNLEKRNPSLVFFTKNVFVYLSHTQAGPRMLEFLVEQLTPNSMVPKKKASSSSGWDLYKQLSVPIFVVNLDEVILTHSKRPAFSPGQLILIFISDMVLSVKSFSSFLPLLLHLGACQAFDNGLLPEAAKDLAQPILPNLLLGLLDGSQHDSQFADEIETIVSSFLMGKLHTRSIIEPLTHSAQSSLSMVYVPEPEPLISDSLELLVNQLIKVFNIYVPELMEQWCDLASKWATSCPIRSVAKASFKIYRSFPMPLQPRALADIMTRLASTISDLSPDIQTFVTEILLSLDARLDTVSLSGWQPTPSVFWFLLACLNSYNQQEYLISLQLLKKVVTQLDGQDIYDISQFLAYLPDHLYLPTIEDTLIIGLSSAKAARLSLDMLTLFLKEPLSDLIVDCNKTILAAVVYAIPYLMDLPTISDIGQTAKGWDRECHAGVNPPELAALCMSGGYADLANLISTLEDKSYRSEDLCLRQLLQTVKQAFFPDYEYEILHVTLLSLTQTSDIITKRRLKLLRQVVTSIHPTHLSFSDERYSELIPLLTLINGEFNDEVVEVVEDMLNVAPNKFTFNQNKKLGLWQVANNVEDIVEPNHRDNRMSNGGDGIGGLEFASEQMGTTSGTWGMMPNVSKQESTRQLLAAISQAAGLSIPLKNGRFTQTHSQQSSEEVGELKIKITNSPDSDFTLRPRPSSDLKIKLLKHSSNPANPSSPSNSNTSTVKLGIKPIILTPSSPYQPPTMTDFFVEQIPYPNPTRHNRTASQSTHHRRANSNLSIIDAYGFKPGDQGELNDLYQSIVELDGYYNQGE